ncbi:MAG: hypothetical protein ACP5HJ_01525, partial [Candidatus Micrarchaeia archaeon]
MKKILIFSLILITLIFAQTSTTLPTCIPAPLVEPGDQIPQDKIPVYFSKDFVLTKPKDFGEIITTNNGPYIASNISEINFLNAQNNINLLGGFSSIFSFSTPYGFGASFSSTYSGKTSVTATESSTSVDNAGTLQVKVYSISPEMNGNSSIVFNSRGFPQSEFELQTPMIIYGFYGNFSSGFPLPQSNIASSTIKDFQIEKIDVSTQKPGREYTLVPIGTIFCNANVNIVKNATIKEYSYTKVPYLALSENIPTNVIPLLFLDWSIQPFGVSGRYFIFSPFNVLGQKKGGEVTIRDVVIALLYSYLTGGISKDNLIAGIKNVIYHTIPIPVSQVNTDKDPAIKATKSIENGLNMLWPTMNNLEKAKSISSAIESGILNTQLRQKYLLDPFVFNGSEMLIASYYNASAKQNQLYELWYINTTTYYNPTFYYRDSFQTNLLAVGGNGNKVYTLEKSKDGKYTINTYEIIPLGYKTPSS